MPRTYIPRLRGKRTHQAYSAEDLKTCVEDVTSGKLSIRKAAVLYNIPHTTITNKVHGKHGKSVGTQTIFTLDEEEAFVSRVKAMCDWGFPLGKIDLRMMVAAYLAKQKRIIRQFNNNTRR